jgi:phage tail tape-measure protein
VHPDNEGWKVAVGEAVGIAVGKSVGAKVGTWVGNEVGTKVGISVGTQEGVAVGPVEGLAVGSTVGVVVGKHVGIMVGTAVGVNVGDELGENVSGLNNTLHTTQESTPTCSPTDITYAVSSPCNVSSMMHWSSCSNKFTPVTLRSKGRIATISDPVAVPTVPYTAGITS